MARRDELPGEIERLEGRLSSPRVIDELATVRRGLARRADREPAIELSNVRIGFACKQRWDDMVGDDRVRACNGCDRPVFNLSAMTRDEAERVLATRGLTPCVRFYRRPDGTVMTSDCPTGTRPDKRRRLAVVASSFAASTALASPVALAEPTPADTTAGDPSAADPTAGTTPTDPSQVIVDEPPLMGVIEIERPPPRAAIEWSIWGRVGYGFESRQPDDVIARRMNPTPTPPESPALWEAAIAADATVGLAHDGDLRVGAWEELRTSSGPVLGGELVVEGLPPHPYDSHIGGTGSLVLRAGGNEHVVTGAIGFGYIGSWPNDEPWVKWARHVVGARVVTSMNRSLDAPHDWSVTVGLEVEPIGAAHAIYNLVTGHSR